MGEERLREWEEGKTYLVHFDCDCRAGFDGTLLAHAPGAVGVAADVVAAYVCDRRVGLGHADALRAVLWC